MQEIQDAEILELLADQSIFEKGFRMLMSAYQERVYWHVRRMVNDHDDADDVVQNTFVKAFRGLKGFRGQSRLYTWLYRIATNEALTFLKSRQKRSVQPLDTGEQDLSERLEADSYFDGDEATKKLAVAISRLPDRQKAVFNMRYYDQMSYKDIAEILEVSVGGLKASFHHAARKIEKYLMETEIQ